MVQTGKSLNIHPTALFIPLTRLALFHPLAVWKEDRQSPYPVGLGAYFEKKGPFEELSPGGHPIMTNTLPAACFVIGNTALIWECLCKGCKGNGTFMALSLELRSSEQIWRSPVVSANLLLQMEAGKHTAACCLFFPEGDSLFLHRVNFLSQALGKVLLRVPFLRALIPEPGLLGSSSSLQRKDAATCTHPLHLFCFVGEV